MSVVIVGGNECMTRQYKDLCAAYNCRAKVFTKMRDGMKGGIGSPDLLVLLTSTTSHKMVKYALSETRGMATVVARVHSGSISALKGVLEAHCAK
ncbi:MAG: DUF2325 domain-containing protein [Clostridia bacterium]|nr:DUF2325 domain-containing protein [Clostridia bacterium]